MTLVLISKAKMAKRENFVSIESACRSSSIYGHAALVMMMMMMTIQHQTSRCNRAS
jgi:hypothetical protein